MKVCVAGAGLPPPSAASYFEASDKTRLYETCRRLRIPVPEGLVVPGGELPDASTLRSLGEPLVVRPALSWRPQAGSWIQGRVSIETGYTFEKGSKVTVAIKDDNFTLHTDGSTTIRAEGLAANGTFRPTRGYAGATARAGNP